VAKLWVCVALAAFATAGCGVKQDGGETRLTIETERWDEAVYEVVDVAFELQCDPAGGTVPDPEQVCATLKAHPEMTDPPELTGTCAGSDGIPPNVTVRGLARGRQIHFGVRGCDLPAPRGNAAELWLVAVGLRSPVGSPEPPGVEPPGVGGG